MLSRYLALTIAVGASILTTSVSAGSSTNNDAGDSSSPYSADLIFKINDAHVTYRTDGHMLVCINKKKKGTESCDDSSGKLTLEEFWKLYFPDAPSTLRVVAMDYRTYYSTYIFWLKR